MRKHLAKQARQALYLVYQITYYIHLPIDLVLKLFDHTVLSIPLCSCEVWGYETRCISISAPSLQNLRKR